MKVESVVLLLNPKTVEILFSAHARTLQALILHLVEKGRGVYNLGTRL